MGSRVFVALPRGSTWKHFALIINRSNLREGTPTTCTHFSPSKRLRSSPIPKSCETRSCNYVWLDLLQSTSNCHRHICHCTRWSLLDSWLSPVTFVCPAWLNQARSTLPGRGDAGATEGCSGPVHFPQGLWVALNWTGLNKRCKLVCTQPGGG